MFFDVPSSLMALSWMSLCLKLRVKEATRATSIKKQSCLVNYGLSSFGTYILASLEWVYTAIGEKDPKSAKEASMCLGHRRVAKSSVAVSIFIFSSCGQVDHPSLGVGQEFMGPQKISTFFSWVCVLLFGVQIWHKSELLVTCQPSNSLDRKLGITRNQNLKRIVPSRFLVQRFIRTLAPEDEKHTSVARLRTCSSGTRPHSTSSFSPAKDQECCLDRSYTLCVFFN